MTRRITIAILATVWTTLVVVGLGAYFSTRAILLADLDSSLIAQVAALPQVVDEQGNRYRAADSSQADDRIVLHLESGRAIGHPTTSTSAITNRSPELIRAAFVKLPDGSRVRSVTVRAFAYPDDNDIKGGGDDPQAAVITVRRSLDAVDHVLNELLASLLVSGAIGGLLAAGIAYGVAQRALQPLHATARAVEQVNEETLHVRLDQAALPAELRPVVDKLNAMLDRLEESSKQRKQFFADASHELRTPVAALLAAIEVTLRRDRNSAEYRDALQTCLTDARLLQRLVESLLAGVRSGAIRQTEPPVDIKLGGLIEEIIRTISPLAKFRSIRLSGSCPVEITVHTYLDQLRGILLNLISNAVEYNRECGEVVVNCVPQDEGVTLSIRDTGSGISPEHLPNIFEPFYRADPSRASGHLGLGLSLVQAYTRALGGHVSVKSELQKGTEFNVWIPLSLRKAEEQLPAQAS